MKFVSSRGQAAAVGLSAALRNGAAPDGGLYLPDIIPLTDIASLDPGAPLAEFAASLAGCFFAGDPLERELQSICREAFDFPVPIVVPGHREPNLHSLELFHGPTGAFKDFGARFLMSCFDRLANDRRLTVLAATSGDTGGAVGCAAQGRSSVRAVILYPRGRVSPFQELQLTCWGANVEAVEVDGDFDACQMLVKQAFASEALSQEHQLTSANSINIGRLIPQLVYSAWAAVALHSRTGVEPGFVIPSGNLGHGFAVLLAKAMGLPIGPVVLATNSNRTLKDWEETGTFTPRASVATLANAMDVGNPSNFERVRALPQSVRQVRVELVTDDEIKRRIRFDYEQDGYVWCPHSATAAEAWSRLDRREREERLWIAAATAHPFKFADVVEPLIERPIEPNPALAAILDRPMRKVSIPASLSALDAALCERAPALARESYGSVRG